MREEKDRAPLYFEEVRDTQTQLFEVSGRLGYDLAEFTIAFMNSPIRALMDETDPKSCTITVDEILDDRTKLDLRGVHRGKSKNDMFKAEWVGFFYATAQFKLRISSKEVLAKIPIDWLLRHYNTLHDLDVELALEKACN